MVEMFTSCNALTTLDVSSFNTSNTINMAEMFRYCRGLASLDLSSFNTSNVTNMSNMFSDCTSIKIIYVGQNWNTDKVTSSDSMFYNCSWLVGGAGTTYDSYKVDKTYAHIDGGTSNPGYFTAKS